ncbi:hypothetical protein [Mucilaginibacter sp. OK098]|uniref:hypothetical protein n=1 Tax=Mucilaginibacter sp. OK098 TaxID=1855297 RepID=UPI0009194A15|nr:hypothetical protein [Mucilaginibacter sp. OK098]SHL98525.1 hypothetical protein SAMN05216524_101418 [Mucilaginibacter sp. OK098]
MKNKKVTYLLGLIVAIVWGIIIYRIFDAAAGSDDTVVPVQTNIKKEAYNDFSIPKDTAHLLLNYRDPFGVTKQKDTNVVAVKRIQNRIIPVTQKPAMNWNFIQYSGYIRNPASKKLITLISINGQNEMLTEGEVKRQVKLIKNMRDSIKISYNGKIKYIAIKPSGL